MALPASYSLRSVWVRRATTLASIGGIALVVFVLAASQMLAAGVRRTLGAAGKADRAIVLQQNAPNEAASHLEQSLVTTVAAAAGVASGASGDPLVTAEVVVQAVLPRIDNGRLATVFVRGVSGNVLALRPSVQLLEGRPPRVGTAEAMLGVRLAGRYRGLVLGADFELAAGRQLRVVGIFEARGAAYESEVWADLHAVRSALAFEGQLSSITVQLSTEASFAAFADDVAAHSQSAAFAERESAYYARMSQGLADIIGGLGALVAAIFAIGALLGAAITMYGSIGQRTREIGVLRALGFRRAHILAALLLESGGLALVGSVLGVLLSLLTLLAELSMPNTATGTQILLGFEPTPQVLAIAVGAGALIGLLGGLMPAIRAARLSPIEALRD